MEYSGFFNGTFFLLIGGIAGHIYGIISAIYNAIFKEGYLKSIDYDIGNICVKTAVKGSFISYIIAYIVRLRHLED